MIRRLWRKYGLYSDLFRWPRYVWGGPGEILGKAGHDCTFPGRAMGRPKKCSYHRRLRRVAAILVLAHHAAIVAADIVSLRSAPPS